MALCFPVAMMFAVCAAGSSELPAEIPETDDACIQEADVGCMLQFRTPAPEHVQCPYSPHAMCSGNHCCLGAPETGGLTYPCPSADLSFNGCESNARPGEPILGLTSMSHPLWWRLLLELHGSALEPDFDGHEKNTRPGEPTLDLAAMAQRWRRLPELRSASMPGTQLERLQFFSDPAKMEATMATIARAAKATMVRTPNSLFGQRAKQVAKARVISDTMLFACHNPEQLRPEQQDHRFDDPARFTLPKNELPSKLRSARAMCHSVPKVKTAPEYMQYVLFEKADGSRVRVMQECHSFSLVHEMCHTSELVLIDTDALRALEAELTRAAGKH